MARAVQGQCLCGAVRFRGDLPEGTGVTVCHCGFCRKTGPFMGVTLPGGVTAADGAPLAWYRSSETGERGFCGRCGTSLFWRAPGAVATEVSVMALEPDPGLAVAEHIWIEDKPAFYDFADDAPRKTAAMAMAEG